MSSAGYWSGTYWPDSYIYWPDGYWASISGFRASVSCSSDVTANVTATIGLSSAVFAESTLAGFLSSLRSIEVAIASTSSVLILSIQVEQLIAATVDGTSTFASPVLEFGPVTLRAWIPGWSTVTSELRAALLLDADVEGSSDVTATVPGAIVNVAANMPGTATVTGNLELFLYLGDVTVTGTSGFANPEMEGRVVSLTAHFIRS